jgi:cephalosporin hydroxylase
MEDNLDMRLKQVLEIIQDRIMTKTTYFGVQSLKSPIDAWIYQEILYEIKPDVIIEIGNALGGGTLFLAHMCDLMGKGRVIGLDLSHSDVPEFITTHPRISFIGGDACGNFNAVAKCIRQNETVLIIEDSSHTYENTLNVLRLYAPLVTRGSYFIVEDGICHHGLDMGPSPGPYEAINTFINENTDFEIDRSKESFLITWNPKGYLRRK